MLVIFSGNYDFLHICLKEMCIKVFHFLCQRSVHAHNCNFRREKGFERTASQIGRIVKTFNVQQKKNLVKGKTRPTKGGQRHSSKVSKKGRKCLKVPRKDNNTVKEFQRVTSNTSNTRHQPKYSTQRYKFLLKSFIFIV